MTSRCRRTKYNFRTLSSLPYLREGFSRRASCCLFALPLNNVTTSLWSHMLPFLLSHHHRHKKSNPLPRDTVKLPLPLHVQPLLCDFVTIGFNSLSEAFLHNISPNHQPSDKFSPHHQPSDVYISHNCPLVPLQLHENSVQTFPAPPDSLTP